MYYPFYYSLLTRDCQLHPMLMCFPDCCKLAVYRPSSHSSVFFHSRPCEDSIVGPLLIPKFLQSPRLMTQFSLAALRSWGALPVAWLASASPGKLQPVEGVESRSSFRSPEEYKPAGGRVSLRRAWWRSQRRKGNDFHLAREEKTVEAICLFLEWGSLFSP